MESRFQPEQTLFQLFSSIKDSHDTVSCIAMKISVACPYELHSFALCQGCDTTLLDSRLVGQVFDKRWPWHCDTWWFALVLHWLDNPTMHYDSSNAWILSIKDGHDTVEYSKNTWDICPPLGHWAWCELSNVSWTPATRQCALSCFQSLRVRGCTRVTASTAARRWLPGSGLRPWWPSFDEHMLRKYRPAA